MRNILCKLGLHWFKKTNLIGSLIVPIPLEQCTNKNCGVHRECNLFGYTLYTKESVEAKIKRESP